MAPGSRTLLVVGTCAATSGAANAKTNTDAVHTSVDARTRQAEFRENIRRRMGEMGVKNSNQLTTGQVSGKLKLATAS